MAREVNLADYDEAPAQQPQIAPRQVNLAEFAEPQPQYASGLSPDAPINTSPLSIDERFGLALGNDKGRIDSLKKRFQSVQEDPEGHLVVQDKGLWYRVDGKTGDAPDAWSATKSILKGFGAATQVVANRMAPKGLLPKEDLAVQGLTKNDELAKETAGEVVEALPIAAKVGASVAATAMTGGASLGVQALAQGGAAAAMTAARYSMGRLEGTYQAEPEEVLKDVAFETLLNAGGEFIMPGAKWSATKIGEKFPQIARAYRSMSEGSVDSMKQLYSFLTRRSGEGIDTIIEHGDEVGGMMKSVGSKYRSTDAFVDHIKRDSIGLVKQAAMEADDMVGEVYRAQQSKLVKNVSSAFSGNVDEVVDPIFSSAVNDGLVQIRQVGKYVASGGNVVERQAARALPRDEALELLAKSGGKLPQDYRFVPASMDEMVNYIKKSGDVDSASIAFDDEAYRMMRGFFDQLSSLKGIKAKSGQAGADQLLKVNRILGDLTYKVKTRGDEAALNIVSRRMAQYHDIIKQGATAKFEKEGLGQAFTGLNQSYSSMKDQMLDLATAMKRADKVGDSAYEGLLTKISSRAGKNMSAKDSFNGALNLAEEFGSKRADALREIQKKIRINNAAIEFNPYIPQDMIGKGSMTFALGSAMAGNPSLAITAAAGAAAQSPRLGYNAIRTMDAAWKFKDFLGGLGRNGVKQLSANPLLMSAAVRSVMATPMIQEQVKEQLMSPLREPQQ